MREITREVIEYLGLYKKIILGSIISVDDELIDDDEIITFKLSSNNGVVKFSPGIPWRLRDNEKIIFGWADWNIMERIKNYFDLNDDIFISRVECNNKMDLSLYLSNGLILDSMIAATEYNRCWSFKDMSDELYEFVVTGEGVILIEDGEAYEI